MTRGLSDPPFLPSIELLNQLRSTGLRWRTAIDFDFINHLLLIETNDGAVKTMALKPRSVADFYQVERKSPSFRAGMNSPDGSAVPLYD